MKRGVYEQGRKIWQTAAKKTARVSESNRLVFFRSVGYHDTVTLVLEIPEKAQKDKYMRTAATRQVTAGAAEF